MKTNQGHSGTRERLLKAMAIFMGIFYLMGPFNQQLYQVLHTVSHSLAPPTQIIDHSKTGTSVERVHVFHEHKTQKTAHEHEVIEFVTTFLDGTQNQDQNTLPLGTKYTIDKHLTTFQYKLKIPAIYTTKKEFNTKVDAIHGGYLSLWLEPPIS
ncbi:MAG: hypothetical protein AB3N14_10320 [Flavobacteriaceae bacterium]